MISINEAVIERAGRNGIEATRGGQIFADRITITGSGDFGILAYASKVFAEASNISGTKNEPVYATRGGEITCFGSNISSNKTVYNVYNGSRIFTDKDHGYSTNIEPNTMDSKGFIIKG